MNNIIINNRDINISNLIDNLPKMTDTILSTDYQHLLEVEDELKEVYQKLLIVYLKTIDNTELVLNIIDKKKAKIPISYKRACCENIHLDSMEIERRFDALPPAYLEAILNKCSVSQICKYISSSSGKNRSNRLAHWTPLYTIYRHVARKYNTKEYLGADVEDIKKACLDLPNLSTNFISTVETWYARFK